MARDELILVPAVAMGLRVKIVDGDDGIIVSFAWFRLERSFRTGAVRLVV